MDIDGPAPNVPACRTWEDFQNETTTPHRSSLLSEAGPLTFDALLNWPTDSLQLGNVGVPVVESKQFLSALLELALGRASVFFRRNKSGTSFKSTLPSLRISGFSKAVLQNLVKSCSESGQTMLELNGFIESVYRGKRSAAHVALASSVTQALQSLQQCLVLHKLRPRSVLQVQSTVRDIVSIIRPFQQVIARIKPKMSEKDVLSAVYNYAACSDEGEPFTRAVSRELLQQVSVPWVDFFQQWLGIRKESGVPLSISSVGASKGFITVGSESYTDDFGRQVEDVDFRLDPKAIPDFLPEELSKTVFETGRNLRFIQTFHPNHPLAHDHVIQSSGPPELRFLYGWNEVLRLQDRVTQYRDNIWTAIQNNRSQKVQTPPIHNAPDVPYRMDFMGRPEHEMVECLQLSMEQLSLPPATPYEAEEDSLRSLVQKQLQDGQIDEGSDLTPHWSLIPTLAFGSLATAQAQIVSRESLRLLFDEHNLRKHLDVQKGFHLMGNGLFCNRLSHALFDPDLDTAEREAGVALRGGIMGLRLGGRATWPPASSELRLALMGILVESYSQNQTRGRVSQTEALPGDLSFAVRDLSAEEIDKCMDPDSLEALDFLRLSYQTPSELSSIITPLMLLQYDRIFKLLLRVTRMIYVVDQCYRDTILGAAKLYQIDDVEYRFVREAKHFVSSVAAYFFDTAIATPWHKFERIQQDMQHILQSSIYSDDHSKHQLSPEYLRQKHSETLDEIMANIFLRKRQQPVLALLEEIFGFILRFAKYMRMNSMDMAEEASKMDKPSKIYQDFKQHVQVFITVCRKLSEKAHMGSMATGDAASGHAGLGEDSLVTQLLTKLDLNDFYVKR